jgi:hypothetical protein
MTHPPCSRHPGPLSTPDSNNLTLSIYRLLVDCGLYHYHSLYSSNCDSEAICHQCGGNAGARFGGCHYGNGSF